MSKKLNFEAEKAVADALFKFATNIIPHSSPEHKKMKNLLLRLNMLYLLDKDGFDEVCDIVEEYAEDAEISHSMDQYDNGSCYDENGEPVIH